MIDILSSQQGRISDICASLGIRRLEVFGSAATGQFDVKHSDIDFIVEFGNFTGSGSLLNRYLELASQLEALLGYRVDLLTPNSIRNPYFLQKVNESRVLIYEASIGEASF
jgi:hypothetical protein